jgi:hypothetical protein
MVSPSDGTLGPRVALSEGGEATPRSAGVPPAVRKRARWVRVWNISVSWSRVVAVTV